MYVDELISVIIPIYNMEMYLGRCLDSILNNTYKKLEIICVNDGSSDSSSKIVKEYCNRDSRIILIEKKNGGVSSARNAGLNCANGEYVAFIDPDDWVDVHYFEYLYRAIKEKNADIALCTHQKTTNDFSFDNSDIFSARSLPLKSFLAEHDLKSYIWGRIYKHSLISDLYFDEKAKIEDVLFNFTVAATHPEARIALVDLPLYAYFIREESLVSQIDEEAILQLIASYSGLYQKSTSETLKSALAEEMVKRGLSARYVYLLKSDKKHIEKCNRLISDALKSNINKRLLYQAMYYFPMVYRSYRISKDKTLLIYEKNIRNSNKYNSNLILNGKSKK